MSLYTSCNYRKKLFLLRSKLKNLFLAFYSSFNVSLTIPFKLTQTMSLTFLNFTNYIAPASLCYIDRSFEISKHSNFSQIVVPTEHTVQHMFLLKSMLTHKRNVLLVGPTGTGKSVYVAAQLRRLASGFDQPHLENGALAKEKKISYTTTCALSFSAQTSANTTQDIIDAQVYKIRKGIYGPSSGGKRMVALEQRHGFFFVDDLNMPQKEEYGE